MRKISLIKLCLYTVLFVVLCGKVFAQTPDPAFLQKAIVVLQQQRNAATDREAQAQTQIAIMGEEITKLKERISELEKKEEVTK